MRAITPEFQAHLDSGITTLCLLLRISPRVPGYGSIGITSLDRDETYNDGDGSIVYKAKVGMVPANIVTQEAMEVGNSEFQHLIPQFDLTITEEMLRAGVFDQAWFWIYLVNYEDHSMGHVELMHGQTGQMLIDNGVSFWSEFTDLTKILKQNMVEKDSILCRASFGSQPFGTGGGVVEERFPCGKNLAALWTTAKTVTHIGLETNISFRASALGAAANTYVPGVIEWLTGDNTGRTHSVESQDALGWISLSDQTMFPVQVGDTFKIRHDCTKWIDGDKGCKANWADVSDVEWKLHYRGEPLIPISDADSINTPGATVGTGDA